MGGLTVVFCGISGEFVTQIKRHKTQGGSLDLSPILVGAFVSLFKLSLYLGE